jgi:hypothetical protein
VTIHLSYNLCENSAYKVSTSEKIVTNCRSMFTTTTTVYTFSESISGHIARPQRLVLTKGAGMSKRIMHCHWFNNAQSHHASHSHCTFISTNCTHDVLPEQESVQAISPNQRSWIDWPLGPSELRPQHSQTDNNTQKSERRSCINRFSDSNVFEVLSKP